jgi:hypothetical protein
VIFLGFNGQTTVHEIKLTIDFSILRARTSKLHDRLIWPGLTGCQQQHGSYQSNRKKVHQQGSPGSKLATKAARALPLPTVVSRSPTGTGLNWLFVRSAATRPPSQPASCPPCFVREIAQDSSRPISVSIGLLAASPGVEAQPRRSLRGHQLPPSTPVSPSCPAKDIQLAPAASVSVLSSCRASEH